MDRTLAIGGLAVLGAYALTSSSRSAAGPVRPTPPADANRAAQGLAQSTRGALCGVEVAPAVEGPLAIYGAQLDALCAAHGNRRGLARGGHRYPDRLPLDCALAWGEQWRAAFQAWYTGALQDFLGADQFRVVQLLEPARQAWHAVSDALVAAQRLSGRLREEDSLSVAFESIGLAGSETAALVRPGIDSIVDAIRILAREMEAVYDIAGTVDPGDSYWSYFADKLGSNVVQPVAGAAGEVGGSVLETLFSAGAQLVLSPIGAAAVAYLAWRHLA